MNFWSKIKELLKPKNGSNSSVSATSTTADTVKNKQQKKKNLIAILSSVTAGITILVIGVFTYYNYKGQVEQDADASRTVTSSLDAGRLVMIRNNMSSTLGLTPITTNDSNIDTWGGALEVYFNKYGNDDKIAIAKQAGIDPNLSTSEPYSMAKFAIAAKTYNNGEYIAVYNTIKENLVNVAKLNSGENNNPVDGDALLQKLASGVGYNSRTNLSLQNVIDYLVKLDKVDAKDVVSILNNRAGVAGNVKLNDNNTYQSGDVIFPDILHLNASSKNSIDRKLGFIYAPSNVAKFDLVSIDRGSYYDIIVSVRDGESYIYSDGRLIQTTRSNTTESLIEPALVAKLIKKEAPANPEYSISKECIYQGSRCSSVPAGATVEYTVQVKSINTNTSGVSVLDISTKSVLDSIAISSFTKDGVNILSDANVKQTNNGENLAAYIGDLNIGKTAILKYTAKTKSSLTNGTLVQNDATIYVGTDKLSQFTATTKFVINTSTTPSPATDPVLTINKTCTHTNGSNYQQDCGEFKPGETVFFKIDVTVSKADASNIKVKDVFNSGIYNGNAQLLELPMSTSVENSNSTSFDWNIGNMKKDQTYSLKYFSTIASNTSARNDEKNTASLYLNNVNKASSQAWYDIKVTANPTPVDPNVVITKSCTSYDNRNNDTSYVDHCGDFERSAKVCYLVKVTATQGDPKSVVVKDNHNTGVVGNSITDTSTSKGNVVDNNGTHTWTIGDMSNGSSQTFKYCQEIKADAQKQSNVNADAIVYINTNTQKASDDAKFNVIVPELTIDKSCVKQGTNLPCASANLHPNDAVTYTVVVTAKNATAKNTQLEDDYDQAKINSLEVGTSYSVNNNGDKIIWNLGTINKDATVTVTYNAKVTDVTGQTNWDVKNTAGTWATGISKVTDDYTFPVTRLANNVPAITVDKTCVKPGTETDCKTAGIKVGETVEYRVKVSSVGTAPAINVTVVDDYPEEYLSNILFLADAGTISNGVINWSLGDMNAGIVKTLKYTATVKTNAEGKTVNNVVTAKANNIAEQKDNTDFPVGGGNNFQATKECVSKIDQNKSCADAKLVPGDWVVYKITVANKTSGEWKNVKVKDTYDSKYLSQVANISDSGVYNINNGIIDWSLGNIAAGTSKTVTFEAKISPEALNGVTQRTIVNIAVISSDNYNNIEAQNQFTISAIASGGTTPRSGGVEILSGIILTTLIGAAGYFFYKRRKLANAFAPERSREE